MPHFDSITVQIIVGICFALAVLLRNSKVKVSTRRYSLNKNAQNPDDVMKQLDSIEETIKQANESGKKIIMIRRNIRVNANDGSKSIDTDIINPEDEMRVLHDIKETVLQPGNSFESTGVISGKGTPSHISAFPSVSVKVGRHVSLATSNPIKTLVIGIICAICGVVTAFVVNYEQQTALASVSWPTTEGTITRSYNSYRKFETTPKITYSYNVNGQKYSNNRIAFNDTWVQDHYDAPKKFPVGTVVKVHYSPDNPSHSCLEMGNHTYLGQRLYLAIFFFACAIFMIFISATSFQKQSEINNNTLIQQ